MSTLFVGDVHGCARELNALLERAGFSPGTDRLLLTGDAFARGPEPLEVWRLIERLGPQMVLGNHDDRLLRQLQALQQGEETRGRKPDHQATLTALQPVVARLLPWLEGLPLFVVEKGFLLVHAGIHPTAGLAGTSREELLSIRTWPPVEEDNGSRWHQVCPPQERLLIFGHDAPGGLVVKRRPDGTPWLLGLDTGCVYGGQLSGYLLEEDRVVQVPCQRPGGYYP
ncbi:MAG: metallophosphoesterase [Candidatus Latescibacterota bacterium]